MFSQCNFVHNDIPEAGRLPPKKQPFTRSGQLIFKWRFCLCNLHVAGIAATGGALNLSQSLVKLIKTPVIPPTAKPA